MSIVDCRSSPRLERPVQFPLLHPLLPPPLRHPSLLHSSSPPLHHPSPPPPSISTTPISLLLPTARAVAYSAVCHTSPTFGSAASPASLREYQPTIRVREHLRAHAESLSIGHSPRACLPLRPLLWRTGHSSEGCLHRSSFGRRSETWSLLSSIGREAIWTRSLLQPRVRVLLERRILMRTVPGSLLIRTSLHLSLCIAYVRVMPL